MYLRVRLFIRIFVPWLATALLVLLVPAGFTLERPGSLAAAETAPKGPAAAPASPAAPAPAPAAPPSAPAVAPAAPEPAPVTGPPAAAPETPPAAPAKTKKAAKGKQGKKGAKTPKWQQAAPPGKIAPPGKYNAGEDPEFAKQHGWPVKTPPILPGSILPAKRIVAYYGNPRSKKMGALGEYPKDEMLRRLKVEVAKWEKADPALPVQPALHLVAVVAQGEPGKSGKYRMIHPDALVNEVYGWAKEVNGILFVDIQTGHSDLRTILPRFEWILKNPDVHLGIDPEFNLIKSGKIPCTKIGTYDAADINYAAGYLAELVKKYNLPPKVLIVHRFTRNMVTNAENVKLRPEVQVVMNMDGWGAPWLKRDSYRDYIVAHPVEYTGFKLFYHNDTKKGDPLMTPEDVLKLNPKPIYIQYQ
jgi:2-hydroxychromene-2-carboxylate isomerase